MKVASFMVSMCLQQINIFWSSNIFATVRGKRVFDGKICGIDGGMFQSMFYFESFASIIYQFHKNASIV